MATNDPLVPCSDCGVSVPRSETYGAEPDLVCARCAEGIRRRMHVRFRPITQFGRPFVTLAIIGLCGLLFVFEHVLLGQNSANWMWNLAGLYMHMGPWLWSGDVTSLFTTTFMHADVIHIFFNMWWCWELGRATEWGFGRWALVLIVLGCGPVAGGVEWMVNGPGVGFSGVVYGLAFFLFAHRKTNPIAAAVMTQRTANFLGMWFIVCIVLTLIGSWNVANWAHGVGGLWGYLVGRATLHRRRRLLVPAAVLATLAMIALVPFAAFGSQAKARDLDETLRAMDATRLQRWMVYRSVPIDADPPDADDDQPG